MKHCVYCGDWFECRDHMIPRAWSSVYRTYARGETVPCCRMCNNLAGDYRPDSLADKALYISNRYERRFKRVLGLPTWTLEEMEELRGGLRAKISADQALKSLIKTKLENLELTAAGFPPVPINETGLLKFLKSRSRELIHETAGEAI